MMRDTRLRRAKRHGNRMTDRKEGQAPRKRGAAKPDTKSGAREDRRARLAAALRENLRRRKKGKPAGKPD